MFFILQLIIALSLCMQACVASELKVNVQAEAAILINPDTGRILFAKEPLAEHYPASITKIATALWALKLKGKHLNEVVQASSEAIGTVTEEAKKKSGYTMPAWLLVSGISHAGIKKGEQMSLKDYLYAMMVVSAGDAANVVAEHTGGTIDKFMSGLNRYIAELGCKRTHFDNPSGVFHPTQKTCAYDMALIMKEALKEPEFRSMISTVTYTRPKTNKQAATTLVQTNRLLRPGPYLYPKTIGGKTGYLSSSLNTFVVAAKDNDRTLIAVFLKAKERTDLWKDSIQLFEAAFNQPKVERIYVKRGLQNPMLQEESFATPLTAYTQDDLKLSYYPAEEPRVKANVYWDEMVPPIAKGQRVGELRLIDEGKRVLQITPLFAAESVAPTWKHAIFQFFMTGPIWLQALKWALLAAIFLGLMALLRK